mmetsp:Transcript_6229/g.21097  ORF Transcript_6229/g.21097 Transcript_6229/m.21097 type:complete len:329 (+) Transcript_6229:112-1098(+)
MGWWFVLAVVAVGAGVGWRWARCGLARRGGSAAARMVVAAFEGVARRSRSSEAPSGAGQTLSSSSSRDGRDGGGDASTSGRRWHDRASVAMEGRALGVIGVVVHDAGRRLDAAADVVARVIVARESVRRVVVYDRDGEFARVRGMRALERAFGTMVLRAKDEARALTYALRACDAQRGGLIRHVSGIDRVDDDEMSSDEKNVSLAGEGKRRHVVVDVLGGRDACAALVDAARNVDVIDDKDIVDDADVKFTYKPKVERLERWMRERGSFIPPPDAIIVFGETFHLDGFPPWQLHAAELYHERAIETFTERDFDSIMERFARTTQRFGR